MKTPSRSLSPLAFVDIETTGLDPDRHEPWEVARLVDVLAEGAGFIAGRAKRSGRRTPDAPRPPWSSADISKRLGVNPDDFARHTAAGDVAWTIAMYRAIVGTVQP